MPFNRITTVSEGLLWLRLRQQQRRHWEEATARRDLASLFGELRACCLFIGHPRSGHSLIGSLIDAHASAVMAHRLDMLKHLQNGASRDQVLYMALRNSQEFAERGRLLTGYGYAVPGQWQGRWGSLQLVGDQEGEKTAQRLHQDPRLLDRAITICGVALRFVHVVRNPFDNISTIALRAYRGLDYATARYLKLCEAIDGVLSRIGDDHILQIRYEDFLQARRTGLNRLLSFLGLTAEEAFLTDCLRIIYPAAHHSRFRMSWSGAQKRRVLVAGERYEFLRGYGFDDP